MPKLNLYRAEFTVDGNQNAWACVRAENRNDAKALLEVVYGRRIDEHTVELVTERSPKMHRAKVRVSGNSVVLTGIWAETRTDARNHFDVLYGRNWKFA